MLTPILSTATRSLRAAERVGLISIEHREQQRLGAMGLLYPFAFPRRLHQMWCMSHSTPPHHPFHQTHRERGGGKWSQLPYKQEGKQPKQAPHEAEDDHRKERP